MIYVVICHLTKHVTFTPCTTGLDSVEFGGLFIEQVGTRFGLPESIFCDRDPHWVSDWWRSVTKRMKVKLALLSSHHPQHDGQTEVVNKFLRTLHSSTYSGWSPSGFPESVRTLGYFLFSGSPAKFMCRIHTESARSLAALQVDPSGQDGLHLGTQATGN